MNKLLLSSTMAIALCLSFQANVNAEETIEFRPANSGSGPSVKFSFDGELFTSPKKLTQANANTDIEKALVNFFKANKEGNKQAFIDSYSPKYKAQMTEFTNSDVWEQNVSRFEVETSSELLANIRYGKYIICVVSSTYKNFDGYSETLYPLELLDGKYYVTQDLSSDLFMTNYGYQLANDIASRAKR